MSVTHPSRNLPYLIVELANSHAGSKEELKELINQFDHLEYDKKGIKLQVFQPEKIALPDFEWYEVYEQLFFDKFTWSELISLASNAGDVWIDVFDVYSVEVISENLEKICGVKLQASVLQNIEVRDALGKLNLKKKILILNVAGFEITHIQELLGQFNEICDEIIIQFGFQSYPTNIDDTGLNKISILKSTFPTHRLCIADHSDANSEFSRKVPIYGFLLGCDYVEKHFCLDRKLAKYDGFSALEFDELNALCEGIREAHSALGSEIISESERRYLKKTIQVPVLKRELASGELISLSDLLFRRTSQEGLSCEDIFDLQDKRRILKNPKSQYTTCTIDDFGEAKVAVIVAGRMKSTRLEKKALIPISGVASIERCLIQCSDIAGVDQVVLATSTLNDDQVLQNHTLGGTVTFWRGDPEDVISRYLGACEEYAIDVVVRVTADCPLILPDIIEHLLERHLKSGADYTAAENCAVGTSGEIINVSALRKIKNYFGSANYSEYMTWYFMNNPDHFKINIVKLPSEWVRDYRLTLDYQEDLEMFELLYKKIGGEARPYRADVVMKALDKNPEIVLINKHLKLKYRTDEKLIALLNSKTKIH